MDDCIKTKKRNIFVEQTAFNIKHCAIKIKKVNSLIEKVICRRTVDTDNKVRKDISKIKIMLSASTVMRRSGCNNRIGIRPINMSEPFVYKKTDINDNKNILAVTNKAILRLFLETTLCVPRTNSRKKAPKNGKNKITLGSEKLTIFIFLSAKV